jgi:Di-haem oxidoreductase, putative peroxidase
MGRRVAFRFNWATLGVLFIAFPFQFLRAASPEELEAGKELFERRWEHRPDQDPFVKNIVRQSSTKEIGDGLGPMFNARACVDCHANGGGGSVQRNVTMLTLDPRSSVFHLESHLGESRLALLELFPGVFAGSGFASLDFVVHDESTQTSYVAIRDRLATFVPGGIASDWFRPESRTSDAIAKRPVVAGRHGPIDFYLSQRNSPPLFGLGKIDKLSMNDLQKIARIETNRSKGKITGRVGAGKFGWRGQTETLLQFVRGACAGELGLNQPNTPQPIDVTNIQYVNPGYDITEEKCVSLPEYVASLPPPPRQLIVSRRVARVVQEGRKQFWKTGCAGCHVENINSLNGIYSDLLLHDMGPELQAPSPAPLGNAEAFEDARFLQIRNFISGSLPFGGSGSFVAYYGAPSDRFPLPMQLARPDTPQFPRGEILANIWNPKTGKDVTWDALQREWRTPPLWGLVNSGPYLHDGRADMRWPCIWGPRDSLD